MIIIKQGFITYGEGGIDRSLPTKNATMIAEYNKDEDTDEILDQTFETDDEGMIADLWLWNDAIVAANPPTVSSTSSPTTPKA